MSLISDGILKRLQNGTNLQSEDTGSKADAPKEADEVYLADSFWEGETPRCKNCLATYPLYLYLLKTQESEKLLPVCSWCVKDSGAILDPATIKIYKLSEVSHKYLKLKG